MSIVDLFYRGLLIKNRAFIPSAGDLVSYVSSLPASVCPFLNQQLDWDNQMDRDLHFVADDYMLDWEKKLSNQLGITLSDIYNIKTEHHKPNLIR